MTADTTQEEEKIQQEQEEQKQVGVCDTEPYG